MHSPAPKRRKPEEEFSSYFQTVPKEIILHIFNYIQEVDDYIALRCTCFWISKIIDTNFIKLHIRVAANATESSDLTSKRIEENIHKIINKNAILSLDIFTEPLFNSSITDLSTFHVIPQTLRHLSLTTDLKLDDFVSLLPKKLRVLHLTVGGILNYECVKQLPPNIREFKFFVKDLNTRTTKRLGKDFLLRLPELESLDTIIESPECFKYLPRKLRSFTWLDNMLTLHSNGCFQDLPTTLSSLLISGLQLHDWSNIPSSLVELNIYNCGREFIRNLPTTLTTLRTNSSACGDWSNFKNLTSLQISSSGFTTPSFPESLSELTFLGEISLLDSNFLNLKKLHLQNPACLITLSSFLQLEEFKIQCGAGSKVFLAYLPKMKTLHISKVHYGIQSGLEKSPNLKQLAIENCTLITPLYEAYLPHSIEELTLLSSNLLFSQVQKLPKLKKLEITSEDASKEAVEFLQARYKTEGRRLTVLYPKQALFDF